MENSIITIENVKGYIGENNLIYLSLEDVARGLGFIKKDNKNGIIYERVHKQNILKWLLEFGLIKSENEKLPNYVPENIFYLLAMKGKNEVAKQFQLKVANEILPQIRQSGMYMTENIWNTLIKDPQKIGEILIEYGKVRKENEKLQLENQQKQEVIEYQKPKVDYYDKVTDSKKAIGMGEVAKLLKFKNFNGKPIGRNILFNILRNNSVLDKYNQPYQKYINQGYFEVKQTFDAFTGEPYYTTLVTSKGIDYILKLLRKLRYKEYE